VTSTTSASSKTVLVSASSPASQSKMWLEVLPLLVVADDRRLGLERPPRVHDDGQRLVVHVDELERVAAA
jgi:hypothetical protein